MKLIVCLCFLVAAASAQYFLPPFGYPLIPRFGVGEDVYGASLGGAKVGIYGKSHGLGGYQGGFPFNRGQGGSDVSGASLAGAKVGLYGKEH